MPTAFVLVAALTIGLASAAQVKLGEPASDPAKERAHAVERAKTHLAEKLKLPKKEITLESAEETTWSDASLGCPEKGHMYAQVVTSGWLVRLKAQKRPHEVHVSAKRVVLCPEKNTSTVER